MSNIFVTLKNVCADGFDNCSFIENHKSVKDYGNYVRMIKKIMKIINFVSLA